MLNDLKESDLYEPIKAFFIENGYRVNGEVKSIDMVVNKDDELIAVELKTTFNLKLILQAVDRQKMIESVYVAIFKPKTINRRYKEVVHLIKRLELGLITVNMLKSGTRVVIEHHPLGVNRKTNHKKRKLIIKEIKNRSGVVDNVGGTTGIKQVTVYRESSIAIAVAMSNYEHASPKTIKTITKLNNTGQILYQNHYGWFDRIGQGKYSLTSKGFKAIQVYGTISNYFIQKYKDETHIDIT